MWKIIAPDYEVSTDGQVRSFKWSREGRILTPVPEKDGYLQVRLQIDGDKTNNRVENLEWVTSAENKQHALKIGLRHQGEDRPDAKLTNEQVVYIRDNPDRLNQYQLADKFGVDQQSISEIQLGKKYRNAGGKIRGKRGVPDDVRNEIRRLYVRGKHGCGCHVLARQFGIGATTIRKIVNASKVN